MGARDINRIPLRHFHHGARTVGLMRQVGWAVVSKCDTCALEMVVDLDLIVRLKGPDVTLWNRRQRCRRVGCPGWVDFLGKHPKRACFDRLRVDLKEPVP